ncbi:bifunctional aminoglycoside phosphotransferase/ATP-binding protein [Chelativorans sp. AA-79]|uniref:bifunctional aminoglycoside phosphotransferase/ATP-binding protein n=1 Tax=Chelativorans sp. AA-79 TaxID=3028735 RepID=UPI0023F85505|nr:bifunctional aminoglycoside phosphotransferase/ATP-binding protein [Chelativorans sp. AA-79]WEX10726.1 AAA family ATPase [Chelativorans sp. AA-79]
MIVEDQAASTALLTDPVFHGVHGQVEVIETHISRIFLAGERAWKMKRAVKLPYVDFSTPELRLAACAKEIELNAKTAPGLYIGYHRITREADGRLALDGPGRLADAVVEMRRFEQSSLLDRMAFAGKLTPALMSGTAHMVARFHHDAPVVHGRGGADAMAGVLDINEAGFAVSHLFRETETTRFNKAFRAALARHSALLDRRAREGKVRRCHGDLHLRNICLIDDVPRLFDCIEFSEELATVDVLYDLSFLLMDLWHRGFAASANMVMNRYLDETGDDGGFSLLPFFMAVRAAVRAHVTATLLTEGGTAAGLVDEARSYFDLALALLCVPSPRLVAIAGLSGSGKTSVAEMLAPHLGAPPGARIVESDRIRKAFHGVPAETRLPGDAYRSEVSRRVYREMARRSGLILRQGGSVVADAVFERPADRAAIEAEARRIGQPFLGLWLDADPVRLRRQVETRRGGPSDATVDVLEHQLQRHVDYPAWTRIDAARELEAIVVDILSHLEPTGPRSC